MHSAPNSTKEFTFQKQYVTCVRSLDSGRSAHDLAIGFDRALRWLFQHRTLHGVIGQPLRAGPEVGRQQAQANVVHMKFAALIAAHWPERNAHSLHPRGFGESI